MGKPKNYYIRYKRAELENYVGHVESCVKKVHRVEKLTFGSNVVNNFKESILRILSRKIGKYDRSLEGVVLDFRNTKVLNVFTGVRYDSPYSVINVETNFYIFQPRKDAIVDGIVKHINVQRMETIISVVIYRVFNVKVTFKGCIKNIDVHHNKEIKIRIKEFHFDNEIPYIEGEMVGQQQPAANTRKIFDDVLDSGISETSTQNELRNGTSDESDDDLVANIKEERESSNEPSTSFKNMKIAKRKAAEDSDSDSHSFSQPALKKIKQEPMSDIETDVKLPRKQEKSDESDSSKRDKTNKKKKSKTNDEPSTSAETSSKKKKKKKKSKNIEDDFESSLNMILNSSLPNIKTEKD